MKNFLIAALVLTSTNAFATRARLKALNNSFHLTDTQSEFTSPYHVFSVKDFASVESGLTTDTTVDDGAEAITKFSINDETKLLVAIGHTDEAVQSQRKFLNAVLATNFSTQQNPIELIYGLKKDSTWGLGFFYSNFKDKVAENNESSFGARLAASHGDFKWKLNLGLTNKVANTTDGKFEGSPYTNLGLRYGIDNNKFGFDYTMWGVKRSNVAGTETDNHEYQNFKFQYVQTFAKDGEDFFYGVAIDSIAIKNKIADKKLSRLALPVWIGFENQSTDWLTLRASIKQTIYSQSKDETGYTLNAIDGAFGVANSDYDGEPNNTEVAAGMGLKFNKVTIDGTLKALTGKTAAQQINSANLMALAGMTYWF